MTTINGRTADHPIEPLFLERWSSRTFSGEGIDDADLFRLFEAARWAPSSSNQQPWRFLYAKQGSTDWPLFFEPLAEGNQRWAASAAVLVAALSKRTIDAKGDRPARDNKSHSFDAGAAWAHLALQASRLGWTAHAMGGFDAARARENLGVPQDYAIEAMIAVGRHQDGDQPPSPSGRSPITAFVRQGVFAR